MATSAIGLDIGTFGVRAGEVVLSGGTARLVRFGQMTLPPGAVVSGEVVDVDIVASVLRRLWEQVGFRSRRVVLGLANQRVILRLAEMPAMDEGDLRSALQFEAADLLPISVEDSRVDFQVLEEFTAEDGSQRLRLLLAAAQRTMLDAHLRACSLAGLRVARVEPLPLALVRSVGSSGLEALEGRATTEAIVCVGASITTVVVHDAGVPYFARFIAEGAAAATDAVAAELGVDTDTAEDLKRRAGLSNGDGGDPRADVAVSRVVTRLVDEIDGSIQFYSGQHPDAPVGRILLSGAGSRLSGLSNRLGATANLPVEEAVPGEYFSLEAGLTDEEVDRVRPNLPTVLGLAMSALPLEAGRRRINLLPTDLAVVHETRVQAIGAGAGLAALAALLLVVWGVRASQVASQRDKARQSQQQAAQLSSQIAQLSSVTNLDSQLSSRSADIRAALTGDVDWASFLEQVSSAEPADVWLTSFNGSTGSAGAPGALTFSGRGFDQRSTAAWVEQVGALHVLTDLWVASSTQSSNGVTFSSTAQLTPAAGSNRVNQYTGQGQ